MIKSIIKYFIEICFNIHLFGRRKKTNRTIFIFSTPLYLNYGDHAIAVAEKNFFKKYFKDFEIQEINYSFYQYWPDIAKSKVKRDDIIIITGGGYAGDLWPENQKQLESIINSFPNNRIIMAPQTIFFKNQYGEEIKRFKKIVQKHKLLYIIAREMNTFLFLQKEFQMPINEKLFYLPDFVLTLSLKKTEYKRKGMAICLRSDGESDLPMQDINNNKRSVDLDESRVYEIVMAKDHIEIPEWLRNKFLKRKFSEYYKRKIVVTDRLHGMIFAAITGTPCVALDNLSHKVSGVYQSIRGLSYIELAKDVSQIDELAWKVMQVPDDVKEKELEELQKWIMKKYRRLFRNLIYKG